LKFSKSTGQNGAPNRALKPLPQRAVLLQVQIFNAILLNHHFPTVWKHVRVISILNPGKGAALPSSYRPTCLLDTIGNLFEKILLARILHVVIERVLMQNEQFGFRPRHSTSLQLERLVERITRNFGEKMLTCAVLLDVAKAFVYHLGPWSHLHANTPNLHVLHSPHILIVPPGLDVRSVLSERHTIP
jgi:hypothetical protein